MSKKYIVIDLETTGNKTFGRFCNPLDERHTITMTASYIQGDSAHTEWNMDVYSEGLFRDDVYSQTGMASEDISFVAGQNLKFDLLWFWKHDKEFQEWIKQGGKVWDTQTVQYLLDGQEKKPRNLDVLSRKYGGTIKDNRIGIMFKEGLKANDIPPETLGPYAEHDVANTNIVLQAQAKQVKERGMLPLVQAYMDHYLAVTEMEANGLYVDQEWAWKKVEEVEKERGYVHNCMLSIIESQWPKEVEFNPASPEHISAILFGGDISAIVDVARKDKDGEIMIYKSGARKGEVATRKERTKIDWGKAYYTPKAEWANKLGYYAADTDILDELISLEGEHQDFLRNVLKYRTLNKLLSTYLYTEKKVGFPTGFLTLIHPDGCLHTQFNTSLTSTSRLASSSPNLQNISPEILQMFTSRWDDGYIVEFDYSQLEVVCQAWITGSLQFKQDIEDGVDFHCKRLSYVEDKFYDEVVELCKTDKEWKEKRRQAKIVSFCKAYGAHPTHISKVSGLSVETIEKIFAAEDVAYPEIKRFYEAAEAYITATRHPGWEEIPIKDKKLDKNIYKQGEQQASGYWEAFNKKRYVFQEKAVMTKYGKVFRYWPMTEVQNYPIQGLAADIVGTMIGKVFRFLVHHRDKALMINEVHDSLILDVKAEHLDWTIENVKSILEDVDNTFKELFGVSFDIPIKVDVAKGRNWKEVKDSG